jgi:hypothetical protein
MKDTLFHAERTEIISCPAVLHQAHLDNMLSVVGGASQSRAVILPDFTCSVPFQ